MIVGSHCPPPQHNQSPFTDRGRVRRREKPTDVGASGAEDKGQGLLDLAIQQTCLPFPPPPA